MRHRDVTSGQIARESTASFTTSFELAASTSISVIFEFHCCYAVSSSLEGISLHILSCFGFDLFVIMSNNLGRADLSRRAHFKGSYRHLHVAGRGRGVTPVAGGSADPLPTTPKGHGSYLQPRSLNVGRGFDDESRGANGSVKLHDSAEEDWSSEEDWDQDKAPDTEAEEGDPATLDQEIIEAQKRLEELEEAKALEEKRSKLREIKNRIRQLETQSSKRSQVQEAARRSQVTNTRENSKPPKPSRSDQISKWFLDEESKPETHRSRRKYPLIYDSDSRDSSDGSSVESGLRMPKRESKSGMIARQTDRVQRPQLWAHAEIMEELGGRQLTFQDLNFRQFVAGELEIIMEGNIDRVEKRSRCELLRLLCYLHGIHDWRTVKGVYAYVVAKIEKGRLNWGDSITGEIQWALARRGSNVGSSAQGKKKSQPSAERAWFCQAYQKGACDKSGPHEASVNGRMVTVQHICARCLQRDKSRAEHPEKDCNA